MRERMYFHARYILTHYSQKRLRDKMDRLVSLNGTIKRTSEDDDLLMARYFDFECKSNRAYQWDSKDDDWFPAICMTADCHNLTLDLEMQGKGLCERCGKLTVAASSMIALALK